VNILGSRLPQFRDYDEVYFADACEPLEDAVRHGDIELHAMVHGAYPGAILPDDVVSGIGSVGFWDAPKSQSWGLQWHRNEGIEITYLDRGELEFSTRDGDWTLQPGQFTVTRPWQEHRVGRPDIGASRLHWVIIDVGVRRPHQEWNWPDWVGLAGTDLARLTAMLQNNESPVWAPDPGVAAAFDVVRQIVRAPATSTLESELRLASNQLLLALVRAVDRAPSPSPSSVDLRSPQRAVRMFLEELDGHLDHQWTLAEMASAARLGRSQFTRYCRELTNRTPIEYLTSRRVKLAMRLLTEADDLSVTDIALIAGFQSSQYFATVFRRQTGLSATVFRARSMEGELAR
jgi:AraC-like DNA-binding protein